MAFVCCPLVFKFSVGIGVFFIGLGQISFFFSFHNDNFKRPRSFRYVRTGIFNPDYNIDLVYKLRNVRFLNNCLLNKICKNAFNVDNMAQRSWERQCVLYVFPLQSSACTAKLMINPCYGGILRISHSELVEVSIYISTTW